MSFDRLAPHYTWMERVLAGSRLQRARTAWLGELLPAETGAGVDSPAILIAGVGHGPFLRVCATRFPTARITSVDASAAMLRQARARTLAAGLDGARLEFVHARLPEWRPESASYDAIVTHFFLDCFPPGELAEVVAVLAQGARGRATWLVADFAMPVRGWRRQRARAVHGLMYGFFRRVTGIPACRVTPPDAALRHEGFRLCRRATAEWGLLQSDLWERRRPAR